MRRITLADLFALLLLCGCNDGSDKLYEGFKNPPAEARPRVWWHWEDGTLEWDVPAGEWRVIRFGYTLTGKKNGPAPKEATGLEVDKMDPEAWDRYFHNYLEMYKDATGGKMGAHGIQNLLREGDNALEVRITNTWANRMVGDAQPDCPQRTTYFSRPALFKESTPTSPAGLYGPVMLICR